MSWRAEIGMSMLCPILYNASTLSGRSVQNAGARRLAIARGVSGHGEQNLLLLPWLFGPVLTGTGDSSGVICPRVSRGCKATDSSKASAWPCGITSRRI
jgi:hypothetical protein